MHIYRWQLIGLAVASLMAFCGWGEYDFDSGAMKEHADRLKETGPFRVEALDLAQLGSTEIRAARMQPHMHPVGILRPPAQHPDKWAVLERVSCANR